MKIRIKSLVLGPVETNCYIIENEDNMEAVVIDPGDSGDEIYDMVKGDGFSISAILLTHGHFDHILGLIDLLPHLKDEGKSYQILASSDEEEVLSDPELNESRSHIEGGYTVKADRLLKDNEEFEAAGIRFVCLHTPGHTKGSCCYYLSEKKILFSGDTLFARSVGRTDLPTGSMRQLKKSIDEKLMSLDDDVQVFPGHDSYTTIGDERRMNPFIG